MSFLKKVGTFFSSKNQVITEVADQVWKFRAPRINAIELKHLSFKTESGSHLTIANISSHGIAFMKINELSSVHSGEVIKGELRINEESIKLHFEVLRVTPDVLACKLVGEDRTLGKMLDKYFKVEIAAIKMLEMKTEFLAEVPDGTPVCFNGENHNKLYFIIDSVGIHYFEFSFFGNYIEGTKGKKLKFGNLITHDSPRFKQSNLVDQPTNATKEVQELAILFIKNIESLKESHRNQLIESIQNDRL